ncbi:MAG TPA: M14 family metallopeptidase [Pyrinomonadaceae bacterium]
MAYMNITEVESALIALHNAHPSICELITLPNPSIEGKTTHAVRLGTQPANTVDAFYLTGGVHAREWGSCEILVNMAVDLCDAYAGNTGLVYGGKTFSAAEIKALMEQMNIIIYPCVNPDGRDFSQNTNGAWRKNRNPASSGGQASKIGVDINRNQDFLWDFQTAFAPGAVNDFLASNDPAQDTFHGTGPHSEPETQNVVFLHDTFTRIKWYIDVHSFSEDILFVWGDDESQFSDSNMTFRNSSFNGQRGLLGDSYREFIPNGDLGALQGLAEAFTRSLREVRGKLYVAKPGFSLYPTSGTNDDYAYSRHFADPSKSNALSFTVEWGTEFQPPWTEMEEIIKDVDAGLIGLGLKALGIDSFIVSNRDTFSSIEIETTTSFPESFYVMYDGFAPSLLGVPGASPSVQFLSTIGGPTINSISATLTATDLEDAGSPNTPQRIMFTYQVDFQNTSAFNAETRDIFMQATFAGIQDVALVHLIKQPNPYMLDGPVTWLSTDVRVFQLRPGHHINSSGINLGDPNSNANAPFQYIQALLGEMRGFGNAPAPPFENLPQDEEASQLELSRTVGGVRVLNFAVAKVRYRANTQDAVDVRVFFRTFNTMVSDLSYTTNAFADVQNYARSASGTVPLLGTNRFFSGVGNQIVSIPYFAEPRINSATQHMSTQPDNTNKQTLVHAGATEAVQYFGCWLDFNQTEPQFPVNVPPGSDGPYSGRVSIPQLMRGIHTCMVAEVRFQPGAVDPIANGATPSSSNRLSQRNLCIVESDNPGTIATHTVQHTLLMKPSKIAAPIAGVATLASTAPGATGGQFDELVIRWHDLPRDTQASIYAPDWNADEILAIAGALRSGPQKLTKIDDNTIGCTVGDISYIPIPARQQQMPALLTLKLPLDVRDGQQFKIDAQQHSGLTFDSAIPNRQIEGRGFSLTDINFSARKVLGAFRLRVAVKLGDPLLSKLVRNLAVLKYIFEAIPLSDPWHPVFVRYIAQLGDQVKGLGVDPGSVPASADDPGIPGRGVGGSADLECFTGKVTEVFFDCFGHFQGFVLEGCDCRRHRFESREKGIEELVLRACKAALLLSVCVSKECHGKIHEVIVRCG